MSKRVSTLEGMKRFLYVLPALVLVCIAAGIARAEEVVLKKNTSIKLVFQSHLNSKTAKIGDRVSFKVSEPVMADDKMVIAAGTKAVGVVERVSKRQRYGINARIRLRMLPIRSVTGAQIPLGFKEEGPIVSGKTGGAAAATIGGAAVLGPIGLIGGLFIPGKTVDAKPGDFMTVQPAADVPVRLK